MKIGGWTRLWIISSGLWLACMLAFGGPDIYKLRDTAKYQVDREDFGKFLIIFSMAQPKDEVRNYITEQIFVELEKSPKLYDGKTLTRPYDDYLKQNQTSMLLKLLRDIFVPIVGALMLGMSFVWIRHGFRANTEAAQESLPK